MSITPLMNLDLPTVSTALGPEWATMLNAALELVDSHDHSNGKGTKVTPAGLNISTDLEFNNNRATELLSAKFNSNGATLTGASNYGSIYSVSGDLYWTNNSGTAVQVTSGSSLNSPTPLFNSIPYTSVSTDLIISAVSTATFLNVDTTAARNITLPLANSVSSGRIYIICDASGLSETNALTILTQGSDTIQGASSYVINSNTASIMVVGNGSSSWSII